MGIGESGVLCERPPGSGECITRSRYPPRPVRGTPPRSRETIGQKVLGEGKIDMDR